jgi:hypothetical protein
VKHIEAGLIVGVICLGIMSAMAITWAFINFLIGPEPASLVLLLVALVATITIIVDWKTEKKES